MERYELTALVKVVQTGSFTKAAEQLGTQKAYLSRVIIGLEKKLKVRLLVRSTRALALTDIGQVVYERSLNILTALEDTERLVEQSHSEPQGTLRLSCGVEFGMIAVTGWINGYLVDYPQMQMEVNFNSDLVDLVQAGVDLAIRVGHLPDSNLMARKLGELHYGLFASSAYLKQHPAPNNWQAIAEHPVIVFKYAGSVAQWVLKCGAETRTVALAPRLVVNNLFAVRDAVLTGLGIAQLPLLVAQPALAEGTLVAVLPDWQIEPVPIHALYPQTPYPTPKVRSFIDYVLRVSGGI